MTNYFEAEVVIGIEDIAISELKKLNGIFPSSLQVIRAGFIRFEYGGNRLGLLSLQSVIAIYAVYNFDVPRPKALLGHQNFAHLCILMSDMIQQWQSKPEAFSIGAAGSESSVMQRLKVEISNTLDLKIAEDKGDLFLRLMPAYKRQGWDALIRITPRPLSTRSWRLENIPGALNATVAFAMIQLASVQPNSTILNLCSGSGTILIEQALMDSKHTLIALDSNLTMLQSACKNIQASQANKTISQIHGSAYQTPFTSRSSDYLFADLPFGHHIGSHSENEWFYPAILEEAARIAHDEAVFVLLTHEIQLMELCLKHSQWRTQLQRKIILSGLHPHIFVLERN